ncbi:unnamed protein product [Notodromas monacha]|uniref:Ubiquitin carboxyl-terminal hydrolase 47 n=1 Tax=Notodromas monacha TaxID=399045 RepID=A0A7R9BKJ6_9CRUS|nr:unnamed protein product [Notodromas monacha]CAG0917184.1 unnamed protein product [Notodromas monacha]
MSGAVGKMGKKGDHSKSSAEDSVFLRAVTANASWPDKEEFLDVIYWIRQFLGVALGLVWGIIPLKGFLGLFLFFVLNAAIVYAYYSMFQSVEDEDYGGPWEMVKEGFMTSFAGFLIWVIPNRAVLEVSQISSRWVPLVRDGSVFLEELCQLVVSMCIGDDGDAVRCVLRNDGSGSELAVAMLDPIILPGSCPVEQLFLAVGKRLDLDVQQLALTLCVNGTAEGNGMEGKNLCNCKSSTLQDVGFESTVENVVQVGLVRLCIKDKPENAFVERNNFLKDKGSSSGTYKRDSPYIGLVNQAMTCYLNSLLQTLFMTPEFRNALYRWEFDSSKEEESKSLVFQLQKLFLSLETSWRHSVETTELTKSFGWDSTEVWQQHDIQELCRVMFDTLELKFKETDQADLIKRLYEGMMLDYVKCLECGNEKAREDIYQDIQLPIRPFGQAKTYASVEEALQAFVQPEILNESNQYFCEKCNKKCDAHKGLKFKSFPYLLTIQMKRFEFDYSLMHRIKVNDRVSFPEVWDLHSFVTDSLAVSNGPVDGDTDVAMSSACEPSHSTTSFDDVKRMFGGVPEDFLQGYVSGGSNTNAYMLMYRRVDPQKNVRFLNSSDLPPHICALQEVIRAQEAQEDREKELDRLKMKLKIYYHRVDNGERKTIVFKCERDERLFEIEDQAYEMLLGCDSVPRNCWRLTEYVEDDDVVNFSFDKEELRGKAVGEVLEKNGIRNSTRNVFYLECRDPRDEFVPVRADGTSIWVDWVDAVASERREPFRIRGSLSMTVGDLKSRILRTRQRISDSSENSVDTDSVSLVLTTASGDLKEVSNDSSTLLEHGFSRKSSVFAQVSSAMEIDSPSCGPFEKTELYKHLVRISNSIRLKVRVPVISHALLNRLGLGPDGKPLPQEPPVIPPCSAHWKKLRPTPSKEAMDEESEESNQLTSISVDVGETPRPWQLDAGSLGPGLQFPHGEWGTSVLGSGFQLPRGESDECLIGSDFMGQDFLLPGGKLVPDLLGSGFQLPRGESDDRAVGPGFQLPVGNADLLGPGYQLPGGDHSEGSSLTDSERTMIGEVENDAESTKGCPGSDQGSPCNSPQNAMFDIHSSPEEDPLETDRTTAEKWDDRGYLEMGDGRNAPDNSRCGSEQLPPLAGKKMSYEQKSNSGLGSEIGAVGRKEFDEAIWAKDDEIIKHIKVELQGDLILVDVDRRISVDGFRRALSPYLNNVPPNLIHVMRNFSSSHDSLSCEMRDAEQLPCNPDETLSVKLTREIGPHDRVGRVFMFKPVLDSQKDNVYHSKFAPHDKHSELVCDEWVIQLGQSVGAVKKQLLPEIIQYVRRPVSIEEVRLRIKQWMKPGPVLFNDQIFIDASSDETGEINTPTYVLLHANWELCFEILNEPEMVKSPMDFVAYLRPWRPAGFRFAPLVEYSLSGVISEMFSIPVEFLEMARPTLIFTCLFCERYPSGDIEWFRLSESGEPTITGTVLRWGDVTYFRDSREKEKTPTDEEMKQMDQEDLVRNLVGNRSGVREMQSASAAPTPYTAKKEVGLTIYFDGRKPEKKARADETD